MSHDPEKPLITPAPDVVPLSHHARREFLPTNAYPSDGRPNPPVARQDLDGDLEQYSDIVIAQANTASPTDRRHLLMTSLQAKP